jgi:hypothetical protein
MIKTHVDFETILEHMSFSDGNIIYAQAPTPIGHRIPLDPLTLSHSFPLGL